MQKELQNCQLQFTRTLPSARICPAAPPQLGSTVVKQPCASKRSEMSREESLNTSMPKANASTSNSKDPASLSNSAGKNFDGEKRRPKGLTNVGNSCYMNSIMQVLFRLSSIRQMLMGSISVETPTVDCIRKLYVELHSPYGTVVDTTAFTKFMWKRLKLKPYVEEDAALFYKLLVARIEVETFVNMVPIELKLSVHCDWCGTRYENQKIVSCIEVHVSWKPAIVLSLGRGMIMLFHRHQCCRQEKVDVKFLKKPKEVVISVDYGEVCDSEGSGRGRRPNNELKRSSARVHVDNFLPVTTVDNVTTKFTLWGMILHQESRFGGPNHYYCLIRADSNTWEKFNDSKVEKIRCDTVPQVADSPSLLIYKEL